MTCRHAARRRPRPRAAMRADAAPLPNKATRRHDARPSFHASHPPNRHVAYSPARPPTHSRTHVHVAARAWWWCTCVCACACAKAVPVVQVCTYSVCVGGCGTSNTRPPPACTWARATSAKLDVSVRACWWCQRVPACGLCLWRALCGRVSTINPHGGTRCRHQLARGCACVLVAHVCARARVVWCSVRGRSRTMCVCRSGDAVFNLVYHDYVVRPSPSNTHTRVRRQPAHGPTRAPPVCTLRRVHVRGVSMCPRASWLCTFRGCAGRPCVCGLGNRVSAWFVTSTLFVCISTTHVRPRAHR